MKKILDDSYERACKLISKHKKELVAVVEALMIKDTLTKDDFNAVIDAVGMPRECS